MKRLAFLLLIVASQPLFACLPHIEVNPPRPTSQDSLEIVLTGICGSSCIPYEPRVTVTPGRITVELEQYRGGCLTVVTAWGERVAVGPVPAGTYDVVVTANGEELNRTPLTVRAMPFRMTPRFHTGADGGYETDVVISHPDIFCVTYPCEQLPRVLFGDTPSSSVRVERDDVLIARVPGRPPGIVDVTVILPNGQTLVATQAFYYPARFNDTTREHERFLFPLAFEGPGAHATLWTTESVVRNDGPVRVNGLETFLPAKGAIHLPNTNRDGGRFLFVPRGAERWTSFSSHIVDRARRDTNAGTEMRVVHESEGKPRLRIINVPLTSESRQMLRVYDLDAVERSDLRAHVTAGNRTVTVPVTLSPRVVCVAPPCYQGAPTYAAISLDAIPELRGAGTAEILIEARTNEARLWAFVSVTNNDTQHVTTFTPQHQRLFDRLP